MTPRSVPDAVRFDDYGFSAFSFTGAEGLPRLAPALHTHLEIEFDLVTGGTMGLEFAGTEYEVTPSRPVLFWGGIAHRVTLLDEAAVLHVAQVPIVHVLSWVATGRLLDRLLAGEFLQDEPDDDDAVADRLLFARWTKDMAAEDMDRRRAAELEIQARVSRLLAAAPRSVAGGGRASASGERSPAPSGTATAARLALATRYVAGHFFEPITVDDVAEACGLGRHHLMASFRRVCGLTLWEHVTRLRLAEARRLLATTDLPILAISERAGFGSVSRLYGAFRRYNGMTPAQYRAIAR